MYLPETLDFHLLMPIILTVNNMFHIVKSLFCRLENPGSRTEIAVSFTFLAAEELAKCHH